MAEGKLTVGVEVNSTDAFAGFADAVLAEVRPALDQVRREMDSRMQSTGRGAADSFNRGFGQQSDSGMGSLGTIAAGSFIGGLGSQLLTKGLGVIQDFVSKAGDLVKDVLSKGWDRLVSIDTAQTKMKALGLTASDTKQVMDNALAAVKGTAFGLGDAATVAATALAAGVKPGQALTEYLKLTADAAAVARKAGQDMGVAFNDMGRILNKVTTQGYATNQELQQLSDAGLPIYQKLAKNLGRTEGQIIELAEKTGVAASQVRTALDDVVGGAALAMGQSFEGAMENARAAVGRLGAELLKPIFQPVKDDVGSLTSAIDGLTTLVKENQEGIIGFFGGVAKAALFMADAVARAVGYTAMSLGMMAEQFAGVANVIATEIDAISKPLKYIPDNLLGPVGQAFKHFGADTAEDLHNAAAGATDFSGKMKDLYGSAKTFSTDVLPKANETLDQWVRRSQDAARVTDEFAKSQRTLAGAIQMGPQWGALVYQAQMMAWLSKMRTDPAHAGPVPIYSGQPQAPVAPGAGMPADVTKTTSGSSSSKKDKTLLFPPGTPIPDVASTGLPQASTDLSGAAADLTQAAASLTMPGMPYGMPMPGLTGPIPLGPALNAKGAHSQIAAASTVASGLGLQLTSGLRPVGSTTPGSYHDYGMAGDFSNGSGNTNEMLAFAQYMSTNFAPFIAELIYSDPRFSGNLLNGQPHQYSQSTLNDHLNHVHLAIKDDMAAAFTAALQTGGMPSLAGSLPGLPAMPTSPTAGGYYTPGAWQPPDPKQLREATQRVTDLEQQVMIKEQHLRELTTDISESQKMSELDAYRKLKQNLADARTDLADLQQGKYSKGKLTSGGAFDFNQLPYGHPMRMAAGVLGGMGVSPQDIGAILGSTGGSIGSAAGSVAGAAFGIPLPGPMGYPGVPTSPSTDINQLVKERNPLFLAQAAGFNVPDYSRFGGGPQDLMTQSGPPTDAMGRMYSDTAALIDRTFTNLDAAEKARHDQVMTVLNEVRDRLASDYVEPVTRDAVTGGIDGIGTGTSQAIGTAMGQAAAGPIAAAVASATPSSTSSGSAGGDLVYTGVGMATAAGQAVAGMASGGAVIGPGSGTSDSILARLSHGEWVMTARQVQSMGGFSGVQSFINTLPRFATGGGVDVTATVGAEALGVSQMPLIAAIVNLLVMVLLKIIGVTIEARDTLNEISSDFREFRGDFKAFDAAGRMMNDTSGLMDRSSTSEQAAADERVRILKLVLEGLFKWIVEKIIVPISKAVAQTALSIGAQAVNGAITGGMGAAFPGGSAVGGIVGGMASSAMQSAGNAAIDIIADVGTQLAEALFSVGMEGFFEILGSAFPGLNNAMFGGKLLASIVDPITNTLNNLFGGLGGLFAGLVGGLSTLIPGLPFDEGGVASGMGLMPKATIRPERVLSPRQTASFERLVMALERNPRGALTTVHAPISVSGGERAGQQIKDRLLTLMS